MCDRRFIDEGVIKVLEALRFADSNGFMGSMLELHEDKAKVIIQEVNIDEYDNFYCLNIAEYSLPEFVDEKKYKEYKHEAISYMEIIGGNLIIYI